MENSYDYTHLQRGRQEFCIKLPPSKYYTCDLQNVGEYFYFYLNFISNRTVQTPPTVRRKETLLQHRKGEERCTHNVYLHNNNIQSLNNFSDGSMSVISSDTHLSLTLLRIIHLLSHSHNDGYDKLSITHTDIRFFTLACCISFIQILPKIIRLCTLYSGTEVVVQLSQPFTSQEEHIIMLTVHDRMANTIYIISIGII